ncbi:MAG: enoyl-CoA hydratase-related protein [Dehalococcoidia bacterium]|nr:enoyl-CoA hydratase-related protein [Dehalococcoidia bacterium]
MAYETIRFTMDGVIGWLTLNRPATLNAQNARMVDEICDVVTMLEEERPIRALIVHGEGRAFSSGADIKEFGGNARGPEHIERLASASIPVVAAIHGYAYGGGLELALACDIRVASDDALFALPEVSLGIIPGGGGTQRLPRLVGPGVATEMILTGAPVTADRALTVGLVNRVVPRARLLPEAEAIARAAAANAPLALQFAKEAMRQGLDHTLAQGLELEGDLYVLLESTADRMEGITAFREKRPPRWTGR